MNIVFIGSDGHSDRYVLKILGNHEDIEYDVILPKCYRQSRRRYPVLVVLDGEVYGGLVANVVEWLSSASDLCLKSIIVSVKVVNRKGTFTPYVKREKVGGAIGDIDREVCCGGILKNVLIPYIHDKYNTLPVVGLIGHSRAGLLAFHEYWTGTGLASGYIAISPSIWAYGDVLKGFEGCDSMKIAPGTTLYVTHGDEPDRMTDAIAFVLQMLKRRGVKGVKYESFSEEDHYTVYVPSILNGVKHFYAEYVPSDELIMNFGVSGVVEFYENWSEVKGVEITVSAETVVRMIKLLVYHGKQNEALEARRYLTRKFSDYKRFLV